MLDSMEVIKEISDITGVKYSDEQLRILQHDGGMCILASAGSGKALINGSGVLLKGGIYKKIEDLSVGTEVYDECGDIQVVEGVYPQGKKRINKVYVDGNRVVKCCSEHLWSYSIGDTGKLDVGTTLELKELLREGKSVYIPLNKAIEYHNRSKISGYVYGVMCGTGLTSVKLLDAYDRLDSSVIDRVRGELVGDKSTNISLSDYKNVSIRDRVDLITGIIDSVGDIDDGKYIVYVADNRLVRDLEDIIGSLGLIVTRATPHMLYIKVSEDIQRIHSISRLDKKWSKELVAKRRLVTNIVVTNEEAEMTCIKVSGRNGLFITDNYVVTHNTTVLTHLLAKRIRTGEISNPDKLLCTTYSKSGSTEMEERLGELLKKLGITDKIQVKTMHATYYMILKRFGLIGNNVCTNAQRAMFIGQAVKDAKVELDDEDLQKVDSLISYQVNNLLNDENLVNSYVYTLDNVTLKQYSEIRRLYALKKQEAGLLDFDDMQMYMYMLLVHQKNADVIKYCRGLWEYFFVDEFQDISKIQFEILRQLVTDENKLIVIGDDDQCIYQWRGADPNIILNICGYYDISKFVLSTNYRCKGEVVNLAAVGIQNNSSRAEKVMKSNDVGGKVYICDVGHTNLYKMSLYSYHYIMQLILERGVRADDIAVLSRNNLHLAILNNMLFKSGVFSESSSDMKMTNMSVYKDIKGLMEISENTYNHNIVNKQLWKLVPYLGVKGGAIVGQFMNDTGSSLIDALGYILTNYLDRMGEIDWRGVIKIPERVSDKIMYRCNSLKYDTINGLVVLYNILKVGNEVDRLNGLMELYIQGTSFMNKRMDKARTVRGLVDYIMKLVSEDGLENTKSFLRLTEQYESGKAVVNDFKVTLSTMHGAKGREWKYVVLFGNDNVALPSFDGIVQMLDNGVSKGDVSGSVDEDRRLSYVAWTRAKDELVIMSSSENVSVYTLECFGLLDGGDSNNKIIDMAINNGGLTQDLKEIAKEKLFSEESQYYKEIDITKDYRFMVGDSDIDI